MRFAGFRTILLLACSAVTIVQSGCASVMTSDAPQMAPPSNEAPSDNGVKISTMDLPVAQSEAVYWAPLKARGGNEPYRWSLTSGTLPDGLELDSDRGFISGNTVQNGHYSFTLQVQDSSQESTSAVLSIDVVSDAQGGTNFLGPKCARSGCYGPGIGADGLANTTVGGPHGNTVSYRFRARHSGLLQQLRLYLIPDRLGYASGTGGKLRISITDDDGSAGHNPSSTTLASYLLTAPLKATPSRYFPLVTFPTPPLLIAGQLYHIVFTNEDSNPSTNFVSVDALYLQKPTAPAQPTIDNLDYAVLLRSGSGGWAPRKGYTPILELSYQDGWSTGIGYIEAWIGAPQAISGKKAVRETFTVAGAPRKVTQAGIRVARLKGTDPLKVRLEKSDGSLIEQGEIQAADIPLTHPFSYVWAVYPFTAARTLLPGETYHLVLQAATSSDYQAFPIRKGSDYGFRSSTYFSDGHVQFKHGNTWVGWTQWSANNRTDGDLSFYFELTP